MGQLTHTGYVPERLNTIIEELQSGFKRIYGNDINLDPDSPDGQMIGLIGQIKADLEELAEVIYQALDPDHATGVWLEQRAAYAGLIRRRASYSYLRNVVLTGDPFTKIYSGAVVSDPNKNRWLLVNDVTLNAQGSAVADFRSESLGSYPVSEKTELKIEIVVLGWRYALSSYAAEIGQEEESDPVFRKRFFRSRAKQAKNNVDGLVASLNQLPDVKEVMILENSTSEPDKNQVPAHSINVIIDGGDDYLIAETVFNRKTAGTGLFGQTSVVVRDTQNIARDICFDRPKWASCQVYLELCRNQDFTSIDINAIKVAISQMTFSIGQSVNISRLYTPINQTQGFWVEKLFIARKGEPLKAQNIDINIREIANIHIDDIEVIVR
ncbi:Uncharacterized homolog of phage Mu protein gp47 [Pragia fontium]|uniref:Baseplate protein J-like domain-containing protein n=1 Tax=Pragia fontium TaxID=82985 RepID=A0ABQ5LH41_9GAMM|nr:baseplate J/gp47 family protein [Pragia fontium]GKX62291.1 hypothetical protein SOASR032_08600 [Pragia fontium]SUB83211.1 Uncharacterized homolog of phage Mu protein gp47 [Pragia fontium]